MTKKTQEKKTFTSSFDFSMKGIFKPERKKRKATLVEIKTDDGEFFYGVSKENIKVQLNGAYAYVTLPAEEGSVIRAWPKSKDRHNDTAHFALSKYAPEVLYAGEATFTPLKKSQKSRCKEFNNASGCYKPFERSKEQAGLPVEKFVAPTFQF